MNEEFNLMEEMCYAIDLDNIKIIDKQLENSYLNESVLSFTFTLLTSIPRILSDAIGGNSPSGRKKKLKKRIHQLNKNMNHLYHNETKSSKECEFLYKRCESECKRIYIHIKNCSDSERKYWVGIYKIYKTWHSRFKKKAELLRSKNK